MRPTTRLNIAEYKMVGDHEDRNRSYRKWNPERKTTKVGVGRWGRVESIIKQYVNEIL